MSNREQPWNYIPLTKRIEKRVSFDKEIDIRYIEKIGTKSIKTFILKAKMLKKIPEQMSEHTCEEVSEQVYEQVQIPEQTPEQIQKDKILDDLIEEWMLLIENPQKMYDRIFLELKKNDMLYKLYLSKMETVIKNFPNNANMTERNRINLLVCKSFYHTYNSTELHLKLHSNDINYLIKFLSIIQEKNVQLTDICNKFSRYFGNL